MRHRQTHSFLQDEIAILYLAAMQIEDEVQHMQIAKDSVLIMFFFTRLSSVIPDCSVVVTAAIFHQLKQT